MKKNLIFLDIDNTLLDREYKINSSTIRFVIEQLQKEGHIFVLNSNRSLPDLQDVANRFGFNGYLIGENGAYIFDQKNNKQELLILQKDILLIEQSREIIRKFIKEKEQDIQYLFCDTTELNKHLETFITDNNRNYLIAENEFRKYSISLHIKKIVNSGYLTDIDSAKYFWKEISGLLEKINQNHELNIEYTESFANILILVTSINKIFANKKLTEKFNDYRIIYIGDDIQDKPTSTEYDFFFTLQNGDKLAKDSANYIAQAPLAKGVEEILLKLEELT